MGDLEGKNLQFDQIYCLDNLIFVKNNMFNKIHTASFRPLFQKLVRHLAIVCVMLRQFMEISNCGIEQFILSLLLVTRQVIFVGCNKLKKSY